MGVTADKVTDAVLGEAFRHFSFFPASDAGAGTLQAARPTALFAPDRIR